MTPRFSCWQHWITGPLGLHKWVRSPQLRRKAKPEPRSQRTAGLSVACAHRFGLISRHAETEEKSGGPLRDSSHPSFLPLPRGAPPGDPSSNLRLTRILRRPYWGGHQSSLQRRAPEGPRPCTHPRAHHHPEPRKRGRCSSHSPGARERKHRPTPGCRRGALRPRAPPNSYALTSTAFPTGPASAADGGLRPHLPPASLFLPWPRRGRRRFWMAGKRTRSSACGIPASRPLPAAAPAPSGVSATAAGV